MTCRHIAASLGQAHRVGGVANRALQRSAEEAAQEAAAEAVECARRAVEAADQGLLGDALGWICAAALPATEARAMAWPWWYDRRSAA